MKTFVFDFDSTLVDFETLDLLAEVSGADAAEIAAITNRAMTGEIDFGEALRQRMALLRANGDHVEKVYRQAVGRLTPSVARNREFFAENDVFIVSGGFREIIEPVADHLGIPRANVFANHFVWENGVIVGAGGPLSYEGAKPKVVAALGRKDVVMVGDGWSDWQVREQGAANFFYAFTEIVRREAVVKVCDAEASKIETICG